MSENDDVVSAVLRQRRIVLACSLLAGLIAAVAGLMAPRTYTTATAFIPQSSGGTMAGLSSLAAQFGVNVGKEDATQSPDFYAEVLHSRDVLNALAGKEYVVRKDKGPQHGTLPDVLELPGNSVDAKLDNARKALTKMIFTNITRQTGIVNISVRTPYPDLSQQLSVALLSELDEFNSRIRQNRAVNEERFLQQREDEARAAHDAAEDRLVSFLQGNRNYASSPSLNYEFTKLSREASFRADVVRSLTQAHAQARIEAARNTPVITILDRPYESVRPDPRGLTLSVLLAMVLGATAGVAIALMRYWMRRRATIERFA